MDSYWNLYYAVSLAHRQMFLSFEEDEARENDKPFCHLVEENFEGSIYL